MCREENAYIKNEALMKATFFVYKQTDQQYICRVTTKTERHQSIFGKYDFVAQFSFRDTFVGRVELFQNPVMY